MVMRSSMWIAGGQGSNPLNSSDHPFYNDLWTFGKSTDYVWTHSGEDLAPKWSPRAYFSMVKGGESVEDAYVIAGETEDGVTNEVWRWWQSGSQWLKDYGENADTGVLFDESHYVSIHDSIEKMDPGKYWVRISLFLSLSLSLFTPTHLPIEHRTGGIKNHKTYRCSN